MTSGQLRVREAVTVPLEPELARDAVRARRQRVRQAASFEAAYDPPLDDAGAGPSSMNSCSRSPGSGSRPGGRRMFPTVSPAGPGAHDDDWTAGGGRGAGRGGRTGEGEGPEWGRQTSREHYDGVLSAGPTGRRRRATGDRLVQRGISIAGHRSATMSRPAARVRSYAASSTTPSWNQTARAPFATAPSATAPASAPFTKTSTTSTSKGMSAMGGVARLPVHRPRLQVPSTIRLPNCLASRATPWAARLCLADRLTTAQVSP